MSLTSIEEWKSGVGIGAFTSDATRTWTGAVLSCVLRKSFGTPTYANGVVSCPVGASMRMDTSTPLVTASGVPVMIGVRMKVTTFAQYMQLFFLGAGVVYSDTFYVGISLESTNNQTWTVVLTPVTRTASSFSTSTTLNVITLVNGSTSRLFIGTTQQGTDYTNSNAISIGGQFELKDFGGLNCASVGAADYECARVATVSGTPGASDTSDMDTWLTSNGVVTAQRKIFRRTNTLLRM